MRPALCLAPSMPSAASRERSNALTCEAETEVASMSPQLCCSSAPPWLENASDEGMGGRRRTGGRK